MARMQKLEADGPACTPWSGPSGVSLVTSQCPQPRAARDDTSQEEHLFNIPGPVLPLGSPMASSYSLTNSRCPDLIPDHSPQTLPSQKNQLVKRCRTPSQGYSRTFIPGGTRKLVERDSNPGFVHHGQTNQGGRQVTQLSWEQGCFRCQLRAGQAAYGRSFSVTQLPCCSPPGRPRCRCCGQGPHAQAFSALDTPFPHSPL